MKRRSNSPFQWGRGMFKNNILLNLRYSGKALMLYLTLFDALALRASGRLRVRSKGNLSFRY